CCAIFRAEPGNGFRRTLSMHRKTLIAACLVLGSIGTALAVPTVNFPTHSDQLFPGLEPRRVLPADTHAEGHSGLYFSSEGNIRLEVKDYNSDGIPDSAVCDEGHGVSIQVGDGSGAFTKVWTLDTPGIPVGVASGDFNSDGAQDLAVLSPNGGGVAI